MNKLSVYYAIKSFMLIRVSILIKYYAFFYVNLRLLRKSPLILILSFGKVGSSSIYRTLLRSGYRKTFHLHLINENTITKIINNRKRNKNIISFHVWVSYYLVKKISFATDEVYIITCIREPFSRRISAFYQNTEKFSDRISGIDCLVTSDEAEHILLEIFRDDEKKEFEEKWFIEQLFYVLGVDVYSVPFDFTKEYVKYDVDQKKMILFRLETVSNVLEHGLSDLFDHTIKLKVVKANVSSNKVYNSSYNKLVSKFKLDFNDFKKLVETNYFRHFYIDKYDLLKNKWTKKQ